MDLYREMLVRLLFSTFYDMQVIWLEKSHHSMFRIEENTDPAFEMFV